MLAALAGCKQTPPRRVEAVKRSVAAAPAPPKVEAPKVESTARSDEAGACAGLDAYPFPRSYEQVLADAPPGARKRTGMVRAEMVIGADGNITHLRFTRLSSLDSVNRYAFESVKKWHYEPTVLNGERVAVCSMVDINIDFQ
jgi:outer membrane biosynthesis protein TonB